MAHETNCSQRHGKRSLGGDFNRERFGGMCVWGVEGWEELGVDERRVTEKELNKSRVNAVSSPSLPAATNREIST